LNTFVKRFPIIALGVAALSGGAAPFHNLDFESASVVPGNGPQVLNQASAIPGWTANLGSSSNPGVLYHDITLGSAAIVLKDNETGDPRYGQFNLLLISGGSPDGVGPDLSASIAQIGGVPTGARTLLFDSPSVFLEPAQSISVSLGGQKLGLQPVLPGTWGATVAGFSGQTVELRFEALLREPPNFPQVFFTLDNIRFSSVALVPEPSTWALLGAGGLALLAFRRWKP
jgi:hypothetical protein